MTYSQHQITRLKSMLETRIRIKSDKIKSQKDKIADLQILLRQSREREKGLRQRIKAYESLLQKRL